MFFQRFVSSHFVILISWTLHRRLCIDVKSFVQETRPSLINDYWFTDEQWLPRSGKFVNKTQWMTVSDLLHGVDVPHTDRVILSDRREVTTDRINGHREDPGSVRPHDGRITATRHVQDPDVTLRRRGKQTMLPSVRGVNKWKINPATVECFEANM